MWPPYVFPSEVIFRVNKFGVIDRGQHLREYGKCSSKKGGSAHEGNLVVVYLVKEQGEK